ncbi:MAG TPA: SUMF1/EgtB/PvdO family nonheme iron enzyme [Anaerolineales bacterium]|nr:SUMF1/EgtB/PvdO family nonheme iron enzyme [Anaerolineales bacterium]
MRTIHRPPVIPGKTTLLRRIRAKLDETTRQRGRRRPAGLSFAGDDETAGDFRRCHTAWFNAWKYNDQDSLLAALVREMLQAMAQEDLFKRLKAQVKGPSKDRFDVIATFLDAFKLSFGPIEFGVDLEGHRKETAFSKATSFFDHFDEALTRLISSWIHGGLRAPKRPNESKGVIVVLIDDLDRCLPEKTIQVLEAIKLFLDKPGAAFVVAAAERTVQLAVQAHYSRLAFGAQAGRDYLEKLFQLRFPLPQPARASLDVFASALPGTDDPDLREALETIQVGGEANPRRLKTLLNEMHLGWAVLVNSGKAKGLPRADFARWQVLQRVAPDFCDHLRDDITSEKRRDFLAAAEQWGAGMRTGQWPEGVDSERLQRTFQGWADNLRLLRLLHHFRERGYSEGLSDPLVEAMIHWGRPPDLVVRLEATELRVQAGLGGVAVREKKEAWIEIPAGSFVMGSSEDNTLADEDEQPRHTVEIPYAYRIARTPVTNAEFQGFVEQRGYQTQAEASGDEENWRHPRGPDSSLDGKEDHPVVQVSWRDARAYCEWLTEALRGSPDLPEGWTARLPSEAQWEKAARGEYGLEWPWGNEWDAKRCNSSEAGVGDTTPVGSFSPAGDSPYGVADMAGNVWEWTRSLFRPYPYDASDGREDLEAEGPRVLRGGAFIDLATFVRCAFRGWLDPFDGYWDLGFRVVVSLSISER